MASLVSTENEPIENISGMTPKSLIPFVCMYAKIWPFLLCTLFWKFMPGCTIFVGCCLATIDVIGSLWAKGWVWLTESWPVGLLCNS